MFRLVKTMLFGFLAVATMLLFLGGTMDTYQGMKAAKVRADQKAKGANFPAPGKRD